MAHALLLQGQAERAIAEAGKAGPGHAGYAGRIRGRAWMELGEMPRAAAAFDAALAAAPGDDEVWTDIARFRRAGGELGGAIEAADKAVRLDPQNVEALMLRGELTRSQYGLSAALSWFDRALEIDPDHVLTRLERAATLADLGRMKAMLADTRLVLSLSPGQPMAYYLQAVLAARAKKFQLARSLYQRTRGALDAQPAGMLLASVIDIETGNVERATGRLTKLVELQPENVKARRLLAAAQWRSGDPASTIATLRPLAERADADSYVLTLIGQAFAKQGDVRTASLYLARAAAPQRRSATALLAPPLDDRQLAALRRSADAKPGDAGLQVQLIRALLGRGFGKDAFARARRLQAANPGAPDAHILVGDALGINGQYAAAADEYRKAANLAFTEPVALRLVEALRNAGDARRATQVLELFLQQNPQSVPVQLLAGNLYMEAKRWDEAIAAYEALRTRLGNRDATVLNNLAWAYSEKGDFDRAIPLARKAWSLNPNNPATADTLGWLLFKSGEDPALGLALLEQAARGAPSDGEIQRHLMAAQSG
jgi:tetratricopeptide (TPR) repeat protein